MKYVLDSSVAFKWEVIEAYDSQARGLRDDYRKAVHELLAPDVFPVEVGHALTCAERQGRVAPPVGRLFWQAVMADSPRLCPSLPLMLRAYDISSRMRIGIYDCLYVALAERKGCEFVTADDKLVKNVQQQFPFVVALSAMP